MSKQPDIHTIHKLIGQITYTSAKIEFLLANMAIDLGLFKYYPEFYMENNFQSKIQLITSKGKSLVHDPEIQNALVEYSERLLKLLEKKNRLMISVILNHDDEYLFHNFRKPSKLISRAGENYTPREILELNEALTDLHNNLHSFWGKFSNAVAKG